MSIIYTKELTQKDYKNIAQLLAKDKIIFYPTETVYGLGGKAFSERVENKIYKIKKREKKKKFVLLIRDLKMLKKYVLLNKDQESFLKKIWPDGVSAILENKRNRKKIAFRISSHPFVRNLFSYIEFPLISTSANLSGAKPVRSIKELKNQIKKDVEKIDIIIDWGALPPKKPSKIIDLTSKPFKIIRK